MKKLLLSYLIFCIGLTSSGQTGYERRTIQILPDSHLEITGDTNISKFKCDFNTKSLERTFDLEYRALENHLNFKNAILKLNNVDFDCGNRAINKDFHVLLKTEKHPQITLELTEIHLYNEYSGNAYTTITIAGKSKDYSLPIDIVKKGAAANYSGNLKLDIRDFDLEPPKKMFGLIVIKDEIEIEFNLAVKIQ